MSLDVPTTVLERAEQGEVDDSEFVEIIRTSLPYAWQVVSGTVAELTTEETATAENATPPPSEEQRGQLLRAFASDAIKTALQRHFGVTLAFQNCHRVAAFRPSPVGEAAHAAFTSTRAQLLNQSPELRDC